MGILKRILLNTGVQNIIGTALICGAVLGGVITMTNDTQVAPSASPVRHFGQSSCPATGYSNAVSAVSSNMPVVQHTTLDQIGRGAVAVSTTPSSNHSTSGVSVSIGKIGSLTQLSNVAFGGGGGVYSGGGGSSAGGGGGSVSGGGAGGGMGMIAMAPVLGGGSAGGSVVSSHSAIVRGATMNKNPFGTSDVYGGDNPGEIIGQENKTLDNPIVTSYGQPIGDVLWPLLLMALAYAVYMVFRNKSYKNKIEI